MHLLVTYDGSPASAPVFPAVARLSAATGGSATLLRVHRPPIELIAHPDAAYREAQIRAAEQVWLQDLQEAAQQIGPGVSAVVRLLGKRWNVVDEILGVASEAGADLICMATHGEGALRHFVMGSTALDVLSRSPVPVLLVRSDPIERRTT